MKMSVLQSTQLLLAALGTCFTSLAAEPYGDCETVTMDQFRVIELDSLQPEVLPYEITLPYCMDMLNDTVLIYSNEIESPAVRVLNVSSGECMGYINFGFGEYDIKRVGTIDVDGDAVTVFDRIDKAFRFKFNPTTSELVFTYLDFFQFKPFRAVADGEGNWYWYGDTPGDSLYHIYKSNSRQSADFGKWPEVPVAEGVTGLETHMFQGNIGWNSSHKRFITSFLKWDIITIYDNGQNLVKRIRGPFMIDNGFESMYRPNTNYVAQPRTKSDITVYQGSLKHSNSGFSIGALAQKAEMVNGISPYFYIVSFDWGGNPLSVIHSSQPIANFAYDIDSGTLYTVEMASQPDTPLKLKRYQINFK